MLEVAPDLIGKVLVHHGAAGTLAGRIVEAEAYRGPEDRAAHSFGGRRTARTEAMFGAAGHAYVFLIYGMHWNFNVVTGRRDEPQAVLVRAVEPLVGMDVMRERRATARRDVELTNGPGKLCAAFDVDGRHYGADLCGSELFVADGPAVSVRTGPRIGVDYAGAWAKRPWRYFDAASEWVSRGAGRSRRSGRSGSKKPR